MRNLLREISLFVFYTSGEISSVFPERYYLGLNLNFSVVLVRSEMMKGDIEAIR